MHANMRSMYRYVGLLCCVFFFMFFVFVFCLFVCLLVQRVQLLLSSTKERWLISTDDC